VGFLLLNPQTKFISFFVRLILQYYKLIMEEWIDQILVTAFERWSIKTTDDNMRRHLATVLAGEDASTWATLLGPNLRDAFHEGAEWPHSDDDNHIDKFINEIIADLRIPQVFLPVSRRDQTNTIRYRQTPLKLSEDGCAGLDLETLSPYGYIVSLNEGPTQVSAGDAIVGIKDQPLVDLDPEDIEAIFGESFREGAMLHVIEKVKEQLNIGDMRVESLPKRNRRQPKTSGDDKKKILSDVIPIKEDALTLCPEDMKNYEYMDHTADIIFHGWAPTIHQVFAQIGVAFFSYMTELDSIELTHEVVLETEGHDIFDLMYRFLDEFLYLFATEYFVGRRMICEINEEELTIRTRAFGSKFELGKNPQGTEIKAITMHQMKVQKREEEQDWEAYVLVDI